jgi:hypothetical protein
VIPFEHRHGGCALPSFLIPDRLMKQFRKSTSAVATNL